MDSCCKWWAKAKARKSNIHNERCGALIFRGIGITGEEGALIGFGFPVVSFCPWCGTNQEEHEKQEKEKSGGE